MRQPDTPFEKLPWLRLAHGHAEAYHLVQPMQLTPGFADAERAKKEGLQAAIYRLYNQLEDAKSVYLETYGELP